MGILGAAHGWKGPKRPPLPKIFHTYPTMMKVDTIMPYLKKINTPEVLLTSAFFHQKSANFAISRKTDIDCILIHNFTPTKFYHVIQIILLMWSCGQSLVTSIRFKFNNLGLRLGTNLKFYTSLSKGLKIKARKFWGLIPTFVEDTGEKLLEGGPFCAPPPHPE